MVFEVPEGATVDPKDKQKAKKLGYDGNYTRMGNSCWFTNLDHGRRHQPLKLMSYSDNLKFNKKLIKKLQNDYGRTDYPKYDNYEAYDIPFVDAIPDDFDKIMGVPITFIEKYNPDQFEILGITLGNTVDYPMTKIYTNSIQHNKNGTTQGGSKVNTRATVLVDKAPTDKVYYTADNSESYLLSIYPRILIRRKTGV